MVKTARRTSAGAGRQGRRRRWVRQEGVDSNSRLGQQWDRGPGPPAALTAVALGSGVLDGKGAAGAIDLLFIIRVLWDLEPRHLGGCATGTGARRAADTWAAAAGGSVHCKHCSRASEPPQLPSSTRTLGAGGRHDDGVGAQHRFGDEGQAPARPPALGGGNQAHVQPRAAARGLHRGVYGQGVGVYRVVNRPTRVKGVRLAANLHDAACRSGLQASAGAEARAVARQRRQRGALQQHDYRAGRGCRGVRERLAGHQARVGGGAGAGVAPHVEAAGAGRAGGRREDVQRPAVGYCIVCLLEIHGLAAGQGALARFTVQQHDAQRAGRVEPVVRVAAG